MKILTSLWSVASQLLLDQDQTVIQLVPGSPHSCPANPPLSCSKHGLVQLGKTDTCCLNHPGGQFVQTQFWNSDASKGPPGYLGPKKSWTIHGLWPDHCDGRYDSVCDCKRSGDCGNYKCRSQPCSREYSNVANLLKKFNRHELLEYMNTHWKGISGDENLHQHEWSKHGTCISTLEPECYNDYVEAQEVVDYFHVAVDVFKTLPTYKWLEDAGITPSRTKTYKREEILKALKLPRNVTAVIGCQESEFRETWYFFKVRGSLQAGQFTASEPDFSGVGGVPGKSCPENIRYLPKD